MSAQTSTLATAPRLSMPQRRAPLPSSGSASTASRRRRWQTPSKAGRTRSSPKGATPCPRRDPAGRWHRPERDHVGAHTEGGDVTLNSEEGRTLAGEPPPCRHRDRRDRDAPTAIPTSGYRSPAGWSPTRTRAPTSRSTHSAHKYLGVDSYPYPAWKAPSASSSCCAPSASTTPRHGGRVGVRASEAPALAIITAAR